MCAAIDVQLETGQTLLITDAEDTLSWARSEHSGWGVGLYEPGDSSDGPVAFGQVDASDPVSLLELAVKGGDVQTSRHRLGEHTVPVDASSETGAGAVGGWKYRGHA